MYSRGAVVLRKASERRPVKGQPGREEISNTVNTKYGGKLIAYITPSRGRAGGYTVRIVLNGMGNKPNHAFQTKSAAVAFVIKWLNGNRELPRHITAALTASERSVKNRNNRTGSRPDLRGALLP